MKRSRAQSGFSLLEAIVTLVIFSLLVTVLMQALQQALKVRERLIRHQQIVRVDTLTTRWFRDSIAAAIATAPGEGLGMEGDARALRLHTQATLEGRRLREVRWRLQPGRDGDELRYGSDGWAEEVVVAKGPFRNARFEYLGPGEAWLSRWAPGADETVRLPRAVMFSADGPNGPVTWIAAIQARRAPETLKLPEGIGL